MELRDYQTRMIDNVFRSFEANQSTLVVAATGTGKCLGAGTLVMRYDGRVGRVEDVEVGDLLMGPDGKPRTVVSVCRGREPLYRVTPVKGEPYVVNESHILSLKTTTIHGRPAGEIVNISVRDYLKKNKWWKHTHKGWRAAVDFPGKPFLVIDPYFLGLWLGDGHSRTPTITTADHEIETAVREYAKSIGATVRKEPMPGNAASNLHIIEHKPTGRGGTRLGNSMRSYRLFQNKHIPHVYKTASRKDRLELLAGLMDTDGHATSGGFDLVLKSERLLDDAIFIARSLGFAAYKKACKKTCTNNGKVGDYWRCLISGDTSEIPCRIARKKTSVRRQKKNVLVTDISVEPIGEGDYYGFELAGPDRLFLLGDFTVTHNTVLFASIAQRWKRGRVMVIAHREELIRQACDKIRRVTGEECDVEMADERADSGLRQHRIVVASIQSLNAMMSFGSRRGKRFERFDPRTFGLIVCDEAHHAVSASYAKAIVHFRQNPDMRLLGVTATPDRADEESLGQVFGDVADEYEIRDAIDDGYLVDIKSYSAHVRGLDYSSVGTSMGDLNQAQVARAQRDDSVLNQMCTTIVDDVGDRKTIVFATPGFSEDVDENGEEYHIAERMEAILRGYKPGKVERVHQGTPKDERRAMLQRFKDGETQILLNVGVLTEGFDEPSIECVAITRPTKSRALFAQMIGRGTRPLDGVIDGIRDAAARRAAILFSHKPHLRVLDFVGNSGNHKLVGVEDVLGSGLPEDVVELAKRIAIKDRTKSASRAIKEAQEAIEEESRKRKRARSDYTLVMEDLLGLSIAPQSVRAWDRHDAPTEPQLAILSKNGITGNFSRRQASAIIGKIMERRARGLPSLATSKNLAERGLDPNMSLGQALNERMQRLMGSKR